MNAYTTTRGRRFFARDEELTHLSSCCPCAAQETHSHLRPVITDPVYSHADSLNGHSLAYLFDVRLHPVSGH